MTTRCGCKDEGDEIVFGPCRVCPPAPAVERIEWIARETPAEGVLDDDERRGY